MAHQFTMQLPQDCFGLQKGVHVRQHAIHCISTAATLNEHDVDDDADDDDDDDVADDDDADDGDGDVVVDAAADAGVAAVAGDDADADVADVVVGGGC